MNVENGLFRRFTDFQVRYARKDGHCVTSSFTDVRIAKTSITDNLPPKVTTLLSKQ